MKKFLIDFVLIVVSVVLLTIASPGFNISYTAFFAFIPLLYVMKKGNLPAWLAGLIFGIMYYCFNLSWLIVTISHFGGTPVILGVIALVAFALYLSIYYVVFGYLVAKKDDLLVLPMIFVVLEIVRSYALTGFPWLNLGLTQQSSSIILPLASLVGEFGLSFILILINFLLFEVIFNKKKFAGITLVIILPFIFGVGYFMSIQKVESTARKYKIDVIQPSYNQLDKWNYKFKNRIIEQVTLRLEESIFNDSDIVILPEAAFPAFVEKEPVLLELLKDMSKTKPIIFGSLRQTGQGDNKQSFNSIYYMDNEKIDIYDKRHLVPFGEYFPFGNIFKPISYYFFGKADDFASGTEAGIFAYKNIAKLGPLVCFESTFTDIAQSTANSGANLLVVFTNDSWFGESIGQVQHLAVSAMRAAETGKPVIRATQSGISACIDDKGVITNSLGSGKAGTLRCEAQFTSKTTIFNQYQYGWILFVIAIVIYRNIKRKQDLEG